MRLTLALSFFLVVATVGATPRTDSLLVKLDSLLKQREFFLKKKEDRIASLKDQVKLSPDKFYTYEKIYEEYKSFIYDSAFSYARKMQTEAYRSNDPIKIASSKIKLSFVLLSSGMFNEALDTLHTISRDLPDSIDIAFYSVLSRTYYDLVDFNRDNYFTERYTKLGNQYVDSALMLSEKGTKQHHLLLALKHLRLEQIDSARQEYEYILASFNLTDPEIGIAASTLGYIYQRKSRIADAIEMLIVASISDTRACTKEALALLNLAELLYNIGELSRAYKYVKLAMDDANFYGARHRKIQVAAVFPIIEGNRLETVEHQRKVLVGYAIAITILTILTIIFAVIIYKQFKKLKEADHRIKLANTNLQNANHLLQQVNTHLLEANKIKEEYIGYYFNINSEYLVKIEAFKQAIDNKLMLKKFDDIRFVVNNINLKKEREELYFSFDKIFLKLFPDFVTTFNSYFPKEDRVVLKEGQLLNMELRIFALIRMGIHDNEKISKILNYSINTIYNYKARIKSKSLIPNEEFEQKIMEIKAL